MKYILQIISVFVFTSPFKGYTQQISKTVRYEVEAGILASTASSNSFWQQANQYGEVPLESGILTLRGQAHKEYDSTRKFSYGYGIRTVFNAGAKNQMVLPELYAKVRYKAFELYAGRRREMVGLVDTTLTSGSYIWSGNALPVPKIQLSIPNYTNIFFKNRILAVKGQFSHGWFGSADSTKNYFLHQSSIYLRLGKPAWAFKFHAGFNHQAQWGGKPAVPFYDPDNKVTVTEFGQSLEAYLNVIAGIPIRYGSYRFRTGGKVYGEGNRLGNHLGTLDLCLEYQGVKSRWMLYRQSIYEDGSLYFLNNVTDGLSGISWTNRAKNTGILKIVVEYLHTSSQGGPLSSRAVLPELRGQDNYFNNGVYEDGWVYKRQTIGTAFLMPVRNSNGLTDDKAKSLNPNYILNNRVNAVIVSVQSKIKRVNLISRISTSNNLGNYRQEYHLSVQQLSVLQQISFPVKQYTIATGLTYDNGGLLKKNAGISLLVKRQF
ncbi:hypothetical protein DYBT9275_02262 [Dyadobacter sp. CECT 9275]|uniref:Capsule assembly protein Wzi n=1 Tax=Dyadobacter helix TaxID=2822344 RepID=A0A916JAI4_9BACT|nr:capsule assembly Wzi family protein [Dyadobacter sp. CECT 9275]CAG4999613.1 hypothetical protein DYBT9275_02262 [Dyadobacter sp. CECT 9275]